MSHLHRQPSDRDTPRAHESSLSEEVAVPSLSPNVLTGVVSARMEGLTRTTYRIRIGAHTDLRMRWTRSAQSRRTLEIGQTVRLTIPQEAVHLEAGGFRRGKQRWNRWVGRVVLADRTSGAGSTTVKIHQAPITLKSCGPAIGAHAPLATWDTVNIVIDPHRITVCSCALASVPEPPPRRSPPAAAGTPPSVWLRATVRAVRQISIGQYLTLSAGGTTLSALIETEPSSARGWKAGTALEINLGSGDAWIRQDAHSPMLPCCVALVSDFDNARALSHEQRHNRSRTAS